VVIELPYPPTVNTYYRQWRGRTLISEAGREYRREVTRLLWGNGHDLGAQRLKMRIDIFPPDNRRRDLDNCAKAVLDALQHGGVYQDDGQIDDLRLVRCAVVPYGTLVVTLDAGGC